MAALRLEYIAHEAVAAALLFWIAQMEAPEHGYLSGVRSHSLDKTPHEHEEQQVENYKHQHDPYGFRGSWRPNSHKSIVDEADDSANE